MQRTKGPKECSRITEVQDVEAGECDLDMFYNVFMFTIVYWFLKVVSSSRLDPGLFRRWMSDSSCC
jgi:hypothetical protein